LFRSNQELSLITTACLCVGSADR